MNNKIADYLQIDGFLTEEHKLIRSSVRDWIDRQVIPNIDELNQKHKSATYLIKEMGELGALGSFIPEKYGGNGLDQISYGLIMQELERGDTAIRSTASVQTSLVMYPILTFGSEEQKLKYLPKLTTGELIGCFGLTEPNHGSNPGGMETKFIDKGDHFLLNGAKMWITNSPVSDIGVVWAKDDTGTVRGLIVESSMDGYTRPLIKNKWSLRASDTGEMVFDNVKVPKNNLLPLSKGLKSPMMCLNSARYGIAWGALGAAYDCLQTAYKYSLERKQFNKPLASFQLTQKKLAEMLTEFSAAQLMAWRVGELKNKDKATPAQISMIKRNNVNMALDIARKSRQILGAMGISGDYPIMRHMINLESVITYEGTHDIHLLITGYDTTGISAF